MVTCLIVLPCHLYQVDSAVVSALSHTHVCSLFILRWCRAIRVVRIGVGGMNSCGSVHGAVMHDNTFGGACEFTWCSGAQKFM